MPAINYLLVPRNITIPVLQWNGENLEEMTSFIKENDPELQTEQQDYMIYVTKGAEGHFVYKERYVFFLDRKFNHVSAEEFKKLFT